MNLLVEEVERYATANQERVAARNQLEQADRFNYLLRSSFFGHVDKGWRFATKTDEASDSTIA